MCKGQASLRLTRTLRRTVVDVILADQVADKYLGLLNLLLLGGRALVSLAVS